MPNKTNQKHYPGHIKNSVKFWLEKESTPEKTFGYGDEQWTFERVILESDGYMIHIPREKASKEPVNVCHYFVFEEPDPTLPFDEDNAEGISEEEVISTQLAYEEEQKAGNGKSKRKKHEKQIAPPLDDEEPPALAGEGVDTAYGALEAPENATEGDSDVNPDEEYGGAPPAGYKEDFQLPGESPATGVAKPDPIPALEGEDNGG